MQTTKLPLFVKVLCVGTVLFGLFAIAVGFYAWMFPELAGDNVKILGELNIALFYKDISEPLFYGLLIFLNVLMIAGAFVIWRKKKAGLYVYGMGNILLVAGIVVFASMVETYTLFIWVGFFLAYLTAYFSMRKYLH